MFKLTNLVDTETCVTNSHKLTMDLILFFISSTYTHFKSKIHNHQVRQLFHTLDLNQQESVQRN